MEVKILGLDKLNSKLKRIEGDIRPELDKATRQVITYVRSSIPGYPGERSGQRYKRTGTLGRSIITDVKSSGAAIHGTIGSDHPPAPWVISSERQGNAGPQAWMHIGRWWTLQGIVRKARKQIVQIYELAVRHLLR